MPDLIAEPGTLEGPREAVDEGAGLRERVEEAACGLEEKVV